MAATLDPGLITNVVETFPGERNWTVLEANSLLNPARPGKRDWKSLDHLRGVGGLYAFFLPAHFFAQPRIIHLHGPAGAQIEFEFTVSPVTPDGYGIVYIGRTSNLRNRFVGHHSLGDRIASAQVKYGLIDCGICSDQASALAFLHTHARIAWHKLSGPENAANRDIIELSLCARHMPPFNVKAER